MGEFAESHRLKLEDIAIYLRVNKVKENVKNSIKSLKKFFKNLQ